MSDFNYFKADRVYNELYYQFPKVFLVSDDYRKMSDSTKIAYMLLKARLQAAIAKRQIDEEGNVYFTYTTKELCSVLNCQKQKAIDIKKNLEKYGLLLQKDMGFNKKLGKQNPNRMYLAELKVTENDIYMLEKFDSENSQSTPESEGMNFIPSQKQNNSSKPVGAKEGMKFIPSQKVDKSEGMNFIQELNNSLDTNRHNKDSSKIDQQDKQFLENFVALNLEKAAWVPEIILKLIQTYSSDYQVALETLHTIQKAKHIAEKETRTKVMYEEVPNFVENPDHSLYTTIQKAYLKQKTEKVDNLQSLIFIYVKNWFIEKPIFLKNSLGL